MITNEKNVTINTKLKVFFTQWLLFIKPFHKLNNRQMSVLSLLLYHHYILSKGITNVKVLWKEVFDYDTKIKISEDLNLKQTAVENVLSQLRVLNIIVDNKISPVYIPSLDFKSNKFKITFNFNISND